MNTGIQILLSLQFVAEIQDGASASFSLIRSNTLSIEACVEPQRSIFLFCAASCTINSMIAVVFPDPGAPEVLRKSGVEIPLCTKSRCSLVLSVSLVSTFHSSSSSVSNIGHNLSFSSVPCSVSLSRVVVR